MKKHPAFFGALVILCALLYPKLPQAFELKGDASKPFSILGISPIKEDAYAIFYPVLLHDVVEGRKEPGNLVFELFRPEGTSDLYLLERWKDHASFNAHLEYPYIKDVLEKRPAATPEGKEPQAIFMDELSYVPFKGAVLPEMTQNVIGVLNIKPEARNDFIKIAVGTAEKARSENGNLGFNVYQDQSDQNLIVIVQRWENDAVYAAYLKEASLQSLENAFKTSLVQPSEKTWLKSKDVGRSTP